MHAAVTVRKIKADSFAAWREAWAPPRWPESLERLYVMRRTDDPDEVLVVALVESDQDFRREPAASDAERDRQARMREFVAETVLDGFYEVAEQITPQRSPR